MNDLFGIYIHVPFCRSKCPYCDFFSGKGSEAQYDAYTNATVNTIAYWSRKTDKPVTSIYFGGGTPSVLGAMRLSRLLYAVKEHFHVTEEAEITVEVNPDSGKTLDFTMLRNAGVNRISVGLQSAVAREIQTLGRIHTPQDAQLTVKRAQNAGIQNVSLDLMMGIPYQTADSLKQCIRFCADCGVTHISSYILKIEKGTVFEQKSASLPLPDEDTQASLYLEAVAYLEKLGYHQYEISNFSQPGFESRHNTCYWKCCEYIGIGPSAHSFFNGKRFYYPRSLDDYYQNKITDDGTGGSEEEFIMLSLRLKSGLRFEEYQKRFQKNFPKEKLQRIKTYCKAGYMELTSEHAGLTPKGFLISNAIISELI